MNASPWPDRRILDLFGIAVPIVQAPMAGASTPEMARAVCKAGGLGSLACALSTAGEVREALALVRAGGSWPVNLNFFVHTPPSEDPAGMDRWRSRLAPYWAARGLEPPPLGPAAGRAPFDESGVLWSRRPAPRW